MLDRQTMTAPITAREALSKIERVVTNYVRCSTDPDLSPFIPENGITRERKSPWTELREAASEFPEAISAALSAAPAPNCWQPIETAPKDGTVFLVGWNSPLPTGSFAIAHGNPDEIWWHGRDSDVPPDGWMPLPPVGPCREG